jgi:hypothetical protein
MNWPSPLTNVNALNSWLNRAVAAAKASQIQSGQGYKIKRDTFGTTLVIDEPPRLKPAPFQIYQTTTWLKYKVKTGIVITTGNPITATGIESEFTITSGVSRYWFYIDMTSSAAEVKTSSTTLTWSKSKIPVGYVDTSTGSGSSTAYIYQVLSDNVFNPCV